MTTTNLVLKTMVEWTEESRKKLESLNTGIKGISTNAKNTANSFNTLKWVLASIVTIQGIRSMVDLADSYVMMENKLKQVVREWGSLDLLKQKILDASNETRVPIADFTNSFVRFDKTMEAIWWTQEESLQITKNLAKQLQMTWATTWEVSSVMLQLAQAFWSWRLAGDEFRSVAENMPAILDILAEKLWVNRWELKDLAAKWVITSEVLKDALLWATEDIGKWFENSQATISQQMAIIKNNLFDASWDIYKNFSTAIVDWLKTVDEEIIKNKELMDALITLLKWLWKTAWWVWGQIFKVWSDIWFFIAQTQIWIETLIGWMWDYQKKIGTDIWESWIWSLANKSEQYWKNAIKMFSKWIDKGTANTLIPALENNTLSFSDYLEFHSPTKKWPLSNSDEWMPNFIWMLSEWLRDWNKDIVNEAEKLAQSLKDWLEIDTDELTKNQLEARKNYAERYLEIEKDLLNKKKASEKQALEKEKGLILSLINDSDIEQARKEQSMNETERMFASYQAKQKEIEQNQIIADKQQRINDKLEKAKEQYNRMNDFFDDLKNNSKDAFDSLENSISSSSDKIKSLSWEIESIKQKLSDLSTSLVENEKTWRKDLATRAVEIEKELLDIQAKLKEDWINEELEKKRVQLEQENEMIKRYISDEEIQAIKDEQAKTDTQRIFDRMEQRRIEIETEKQKLLEQQAQKQTLLAQEKVLYEDLNNKKIQLEAVYQKVFLTNIKEQQVKITETMKMLERLASARISANSVSWARATWWPVSSSWTYLVWEKWPELFTPWVNWYITPNNKLGGNNYMINISWVFWSDAVEEIWNALLKKLKTSTTF